MRASWSEGDFASRLRDIGLEMYVRGKHAGIVYFRTGRRYRFRTLGLDEEFSAQKESWMRNAVRMSRIDAIDLELMRREMFSMGFREEAALVLAGDCSEGDLPGERKRLEGLRRASPSVRARRTLNEGTVLELGD